jgi:hypothetical protein
MDDEISNNYFDPQKSVEVQTQDSKPQAFDILGNVELDEFQGPTLLRYLARMFILESNRSNDPQSNYEYGIEIMNSFDFDQYSRLAFTREYIIRIFEQQYRRYEEMVFRTTNTGSFNTFNSATEDGSLSKDSSKFIDEDESLDLDNLLALLEQD